MKPMEIVRKIVEGGSPMHEQYFKYEVINTFNPSLLTRLQLMLFGKKIVEYAGRVQAVWYLYRGKLYFTKYSAF